VSQLFGGLDICAVEIVQSKDGKEFIVQVKKKIKINFENFFLCIFK
jgi:hypothetical protein